MAAVSNPRAFLGWTTFWGGVSALSPYIATLVPTAVGNAIPLVCLFAVISLGRFNGLKVENVSEALRCIPECAQNVVIDRGINHRNLRVYVSKQPDVELLAKCNEYDNWNRVIYDPVKLDSVK